MNAVIDIWRHQAQAGGQSPVLPDGCRDVILLRAPGKAPRLLFTELQSEVEHPVLAAGSHMTGFRLRPGLWLDEAKLSAALGSDGPDDATLADLIAELARPAPQLDEAISCLAVRPNVRATASDLGVSAQSLQRLFRRHGLKPPEFWLLLARARRAGRAIAARADLSEAAYDHAYADQAHMSREIKRWFGVTPRALRESPALTEQLTTPGLAT